MNLKKLMYFRTVAQELNFGQAAAKLYVDQSSLSRAIQGLESRLGVILFERHLRQLKLTEHGSLLLQETNQIFCLIDSINHRIKASQQGQSYTIELAISPNIDGYRVAKLLRQYHEKYPHMHLNVHEATYQDILSGLTQGRYHFALSLHIPSHRNDSLIFKKLWQERLIILLSKQHPLMSLQHITFDDIQKYPFISFQPDTLLHELIYTATFSPLETLFVKSYSVLQALVIAGFGISLVTQSMLDNMQNQHVATRAIDPDLLVDTHLIYQPNRYSHQQIKNLENLVNTFFIRS